MLRHRNLLRMAVVLISFNPGMVRAVKLADFVDEPTENGYLVDVTSRVDGRSVVNNRECFPVVDNVSLMSLSWFSVYQDVGQLRFAPFLFAVYPRSEDVAFHKDVA